MAALLAPGVLAASLEGCEWIAGIPDGTPRAVVDDAANGDGAASDTSSPDADGAVSDADADADAFLADTGAWDGDAAFDADARPPLLCAPFEERLVACGGETPDVCRTASHCGSCTQRCGDAGVCWRGACVDAEWQYWPMNRGMYDASSRFEVPDGAPGVVRDRVTSLTWQRNPDTVQVRSYQVETACSRLDGGFRAPTRVELASLTDYTSDGGGGRAPLLSPLFATPGIDGGDPWKYFSSTKCAPERDASVPRNVNARMTIDYLQPYTYCAETIGNVRCVR